MLEIFEKFDLTFIMFSKLSLALCTLANGLIFVTGQYVYTIYDNGHFIGVYANGRNPSWEEAETWCEDTIGTTLATITDATTNSQGADAARGAGVTTYAWFGLNDIDNENNFEYPDGTPYDDYNDFEAWRSANPDNYGSGEDCVHWWVTEDTWNDLTCSGNNIVQGFVCNKRGL